MSFFANIYLEYPLVLFALPLPVVAMRFSWKNSDVIYARFITKYKDILTKRPANRLKYLPLWGAWIFTLLALASPYKITKSPSSSHLMIALDTSYSMEEVSNNSVSRFQRSVSMIKHLLETSSQNVGLVAFGYRAYLSSPITPHSNLLNIFLDRQSIGLADEDEISGTALADAIFLSIQELDLYDGKRSILVFTDGLDTASRLDLSYVLSLAKEKEIDISAVLLSDDVRDTFCEKIKCISDLTSLAELSTTKNEYLFRYPLWVAFLLLMIFLVRSK